MARATEKPPVKRRAKPAGSPPVSRPYLTWALSVLAVLALGGTGWALQRYAADPQQQPIRTIRVTGEFRHLDRTRIQQVVAEAIDGGFYTADMERIRAQVRAMPWVDQVSIRRVWPDTLVMDVVEQVPFARWGERALVNPQGGVFDADGVEPATGLVRLYGPDGTAPQVMAFFRWARPGMESAGLPIAALGIDARREWTLSTAQGIEINLGQRKASTRLARLVATAAGLNADPGRRAQRIDLRYEHGFAVRWQAVENDQLASVATEEVK